MTIAGSGRIHETRGVDEDTAPAAAHAFAVAVGFHRLRLDADASPD
jgi:hypothetical protein